MKFHSNIFLVSLLFFIFPSYAWCQDQTEPLQSGVIAGRVIDESTGEPLYMTNVYLAHSLLGSATDKNGYFVIFHVPFGTHDIIASYVGYSIETHKIRIDIADAFQVNFKLKPKIEQLQEIIVTAKAPKNWKKNLRLFMEEFIGSSKNAKKCEIINPEALDFVVNEETGFFQATADEMLKVKNNALGYMVNLYLKEFIISNDNVQYAFVPAFEELTQKNDKELKRWKKERTRAYNGSIRHFIASLARGTHEQEGFAVHVSSVLFPDDNSQMIPLHKEAFVFNSELSFEKYMRFRNYLMITYKKEREESDYIDFLYKKSKDVSVHDPTRDRIRAQPTQVSFLQPLQPKITFNVDGSLSNRYAVIVHGYLAWERVAEWLPLEYRPFTDVSIAPVVSSDELYILERSEIVQNNPELRKTLRKYDTRDFYSLGLKLKEKKDFSGALETWYTGKETYSTQNKNDPRIGIAYIELAASLNDKNFYSNAVQMYMWGFSGKSIEPYRKIISEEIARIEPLLDDEEIKTLKSLLNNNDPELIKYIREFWFKKDVTATTELNERLLEHWERITYARAHFTKAHNSPYGTDDRGTIFVKYGHPKFIRSGRLGNDIIELKNRIDEIKIDRESNLNVEVIDRFGKKGIDAIITDQHDYQMNVGSIADFQWYPEYELWIYDNLNGEEKVVFLFGSPHDRRYGLLESVEELIPSKLFSKRYELKVKKNSGTRGLSTGFLIQMMYYSQLRLDDDSFLDKYQELNSVWESHISSNIPPSWGVAFGIRQNFIFRDRNDPVKRDLPNDRSRFGDIFIPVNILSKQIRTLDDNNQSQIAVIAISQPEKSAIENLRDSIKIKLSNTVYKPVHTLIVRDNSWRELTRYTDEKPEKMYSLSTFQMSHIDSSFNMIIASEAYVDVSFTPEDSNAAVSISVPFLGSAVLENLAPLNKDVSSLEISDMITGIILPEDFEKEKYPFPVFPSEKIKNDSPLAVYIEVYHLKMGPDSRAQFEVTFRLEKPAKRGILKRLFRRGKPESVSITSTFNSSTSTSREYIGFDISKLEAGEYEFQIIVRDMQSGQRKSRTGKFSVLTK